MHTGHACLKLTHNHTGSECLVVTFSSVLNVANDPLTRWPLVFTRGHLGHL